VDDSLLPQLRQKIAPDWLLAPQFRQTIAACPADFAFMSAAAFLKAACISTAAVLNAFSNSIPILVNASRISSDGYLAFASAPFMVLVPHFGQKYASSGIFSPQLEQ
jgi:hypothetical protein